MAVVVAGCSADATGGGGGDDDIVAIDGPRPGTTVDVPCTGYTRVTTAADHSSVTITEYRATIAGPRSADFTRVVVKACNPTVLPTPMQWPAGCPAGSTCNGSAPPVIACQVYEAGAYTADDSLSIGCGSDIVQRSAQGVTTRSAQFYASISVRVE